MHPRHGQPGRRRHGVLLGDADVEEPVREAGGELVQTGRIGHGGRDRHHPVVDRADPDELIGEHVSPGEPAAARQGDPGHRVDLADRVEPILVVLLRRLEPVTLLSQAVHQHGAAVVLGLLERPLYRLDVVAVDRADVLEAQVGEHSLRGEHVLESDLDAVQHLVRRRPEQRSPTDAALDHVQDLLVARVGPQAGQMLGEPSDRRGVRAAVVVHQDDQRQVLGAGDVIQRLPGHPAGQRAVADEGQYRAGVFAQPDCLGQPIGVGQRRGRVGVLHPVVLGLRPAGVTGQAVPLAEGGKVTLPARQHLVDVTLVTGVEDDRVPGRVEHPMDGDGELDDAEVGPQVAAGLTDVLNQEGTDLCAELSELIEVETSQVGWAADSAQQILGGGRHAGEFTCGAVPSAGSVA